MFFEDDFAQIDEWGMVDFSMEEMNFIAT